MMARILKWKKHQQHRCKTSTCLWPCWKAHNSSLLGYSVPEEPHCCSKSQICMLHVRHWNKIASPGVLMCPRSDFRQDAQSKSSRQSEKKLTFLKLSEFPPMKPQLFLRTNKNPSAPSCMCQNFSLLQLLNRNAFFQVSGLVKVIGS